MSETKELSTHAGTTQHYDTAHAVADRCRAIVTATAMEIQGRKFVRVEGWQAIATAHGCIASSGEVRFTEEGCSAIGQVRRMDTGAVICEAEGFVGKDEPVWFGGTVTKYGKTTNYDKRPDYAIRAMAQTRAISRACRSAFAHVVVIMGGGLETTPAEEVPESGFEAREKPVNEPPPQTGVVLRIGEECPKEFWALSPRDKQAAKNAAKCDVVKDGNKWKVVAV
jgi:hypothetical protein